MQADWLCSMQQQNKAPSLEAAALLAEEGEAHACMKAGTNRGLAQDRRTGTFGCIHVVVSKQKHADPEFIKALRIGYNFELTQLMKIEVYDADEVCMLLTLT
jgi:hypothetical protein